MTEENRKENIRAELDRAAAALAAATLLYENGYISDAISRLYYFVLYHVRALLLSKGLEPRSHDAELRLQRATLLPSRENAKFISTDSSNSRPPTRENTLLIAEPSLLW